MNKLFCFLYFSLMSFCSILAQDISPQINSFYEYYKKDDVLGMDKMALEIIAIAPDNYAGYAFKSYAAILKNDLVSAEKHIYIARNLNPVDQGSYGVASYVHFLTGNTEDAEKLMNFSFQLRGDDGLLQTTLEDINQIERLTKKDLSVLKEIANKTNLKTQGAIQNIQFLYACQQNWAVGKTCIQEAKIKSYFNGLSPKNDMAITINDYYKALGYYNNQKWVEAKTAFKAFVSNPILVNATDKAYSEAQSYYYLSLYDDYNANTLYLNASNGLKALSKLPTTLLETQLLLRKILALESMDKKEEQLQAAELLLSKAKIINFPMMEAQANNTIGGYYLTSPRSDYRQKASLHLSAAYHQAKQINDIDLVNLIAGNYAISLWQQNKKFDAIGVANVSYDYFIQKKDYPAAQLAANNLGFMSFVGNDYSNAAKLFRKSVDITELYRKDLNAAQQLEVMNEHTSAYGGLIMSLQKLNDANALFEIQDMNRSRMLRDKLDKQAKPKSLAETQKMLKTNEVLLYYSEAGPGEMIVTVVTNNEASIGYNYPIENWLKLKKEYLNLITQKTNTLNNYVAKLDEDILDGKIFKYGNASQGFTSKDYETLVTITRQLLESYEHNLKTTQTSILKTWYDYLIKPIEGKLVGKKTIIISGEGSLNYLPFEAFMNVSGKYLIESYNIKYIPSATVWSSLQNRNYENNRKNLLAMGGATYQEPSKSDGNIRGMEDLLKVQDAISNKINTNKNNLSIELKALGFGGADYLAGSLKEVQNLKKIIPDANMLIANEMKESDIKKLNATDELANYKWLHIATHGFAMDNIPELSGVMMTQPNNGDGNEDMYLLTHEIAKLNLKADLTVLSACETALGKTYGGEGINGLNSALLTAGSNNTLLSLWPVSDAGTMTMMTVLYNNMYVKNQSVDDAVNNAKRDMLRGIYGEQFSIPVIWAPFVLSGR